MERERAHQIIAELESAAPLESVKIRVSQYGGGPDESFMVANRNGYFRLAATFLRAAVAPQEPGKKLVDVPIEELFDDESEFELDWLERSEEWPAPEAASDWKGKVIGIFMTLLMLGFVVMAIVGLIDTAAWLFE